ncbi:DCC1-like thiol-disulfide oxidoreductase family protein [Flavobacterium sp.]|uniref:DCC1-like thiol-disulfide oxidoreductase family protein n=1 Tax=Flavobacterium sp. TaxID=239 RepID=UPI0039E2D130
MKTLANQTLIYDEDCPLCQAYTGAFVKTGMLDQNGRASFCTLAQNKIDFVDVERAANEIALVDHANKTVTYGIDSLLKVIGNSFPVVQQIGKLKPVHLVLRKLYAFISYNRKVIIPGKPNDGKSLQCTPDFNYRYRIAYLLFSVLVTAWVLNAYAAKIELIPNGGLGRELLLAFGQILFQAVFLFEKDNRDKLVYAGNLMTVSLMGSLLLLPILILNIWIALPQTVMLCWFGLTVLAMFFEHWRRVRLLQLPTLLCFTWVLYRLTALAFLLNL